MNNRYIIPANSKKSMLILGYFTVVDLILFGSGTATSLLLLAIISGPSLTEMILMMLPLMVTAFLVLPVIYYHNVLQFLINIFSFYLGRRRYYWKGWCVRDESEIK